ncbi:ribosomal protein L21 [Tieghemostelium lacteum]|uniref:Large ribosomal subunit protein bL21m n=1 Tax=Tieghemostelium lacteum TaxID=361077 RepID=A0A152A124_TIELA|nr:ribosomal protein L21 [Tieghemostelium lacteum]|eukprot:KYQ99962.1 ribosomal protein L21 [Tieghemostelium lacteum]
MIRLLNNLSKNDVSTLKSTMNLFNPLIYTKNAYSSSNNATLNNSNVISEAISNNSEIEKVQNYNNKNQFKTLDNAFAVVHVSGKQYKVIKGDVIMTDKLHVAAGEHIVLDKVLLLGSKDSTAIGTPILDGVKVHAFLEEQTKAEHVTIFKHKRRKNYKRTTGFTPLATYLRIGDIINSNENQNNIGL